MAGTRQRRMAVAIALIPTVIQQDETAAGPGHDAVSRDFKTFDGIGQFIARCLYRGLQRLHALIFRRLHDFSAYWMFGLFILSPNHAPAHPSRLAFSDRAGTG